MYDIRRTAIHGFAVNFENSVITPGAIMESYIQMRREYIESDWWLYCRRRLIYIGEYLKANCNIQPSR